MKKNLKDTCQKVEIFFNESPTTNQKAWGLINHFYHIVFTYMEMNNIKQADLAKKMNKSRSAISQLFKQTPNISIKKMVEIADAIGINLNIDSPEVKLHFSDKKAAKNETRFYNYDDTWVDLINDPPVTEKIVNSSGGFDGNHLFIPYIETNAYSEININ